MTKCGVCNINLKKQIKMKQLGYNTGIPIPCGKGIDFIWKDFIPEGDIKFVCGKCDSELGLTKKQVAEILNEN